MSWMVSTSLNFLPSVPTVKNGEYSNLIFQCKKIIDIYSKYENRIDPPNNKKFNLNATFSNNHNNSLCDYTVALKALNSIIQKCENL